ncbi:MAG: winged helix-turn-helix transcriptional regulator [Candidatus Thorarchaeota archaeon]
MESSILSHIETPFDHMIPEVDDPSAKFYIDAMRIYLGLSSGTLAFEQAVRASEALKDNPEYARYPTNPVLVPINDYFTNRILDNLKTLKKFNLITADSVRSAYSFAFLAPESPISSVDLATLRYLAENPRETIANIATSLGLSPRTISRSIDRLKTRHFARHQALMDYAAWGVNTIMVFFKPAEGIDWQLNEDALVRFPFIKTLLKTAISELGYFSFCIPGDQSNIDAFVRYVNQLESDIFQYTSIHVESVIGTGYDMSLFRDGKWVFPNSAKIVLEEASDSLPKTLPRIIHSEGIRSGMTQLDFEIASMAKLDVRATPSEVAEALQRRNLNVDPKKVSSTLKRVYDKNLMVPYVRFELGLTSDLCFEIICDNKWQERIISILSLVPYSYFFASKRGIVVWISCPSYHQVEYYKMFRSLENQSGVSSVQSIMTIRLRGSRSILDLVDKWSFMHGYYTYPKKELDITQYLPFEY